MFDRKDHSIERAVVHERTPVPRHPGQGGDPPGAPARSGDHPSLWSPHWRLVPQSPDWDEAYLATAADDEYPGDPDEYEDPDHAPPSGLGDAELKALIAEAREITAEQERGRQQRRRLSLRGSLVPVQFDPQGGWWIQSVRLSVC